MDYSSFLVTVVSKNKCSRLLHYRCSTFTLLPTLSIHYKLSDLLLGLARKSIGFFGSFFEKRLIFARDKRQPKIRLRFRAILVKERETVKSVRGICMVHPVHDNLMSDFSFVDLLT